MSSKKQQLLDSLKGGGLLQSGGTGLVSGDTIDATTRLVNITLNTGVDTAFPSAIDNLQNFADGLVNVYESIHPPSGFTGGYMSINDIAASIHPPLGFTGGYMSIDDIADAVNTLATAPPPTTTISGTTVIDYATVPVNTALPVPGTFTNFAQVFDLIRRNRQDALNATTYISGLIAKVPQSASGTNKFATANDVTAAITGLNIGATYRTITDSYTKSQVYTKGEADTAITSNINALNLGTTYRTITDSYTKSQVYTKGEANSATTTSLTEALAINNTTTYTSPNANSIVGKVNNLVANAITTANINTDTILSNANFKAAIKSVLIGLLAPATTGNFADTDIQTSFNRTPLAQFKHLPDIGHLKMGGGGWDGGSKRNLTDEIKVKKNKKAKTMKK